MDKGFALGQTVSSDGKSILFGNADLARLQETGATVVRFDISLFNHVTWDKEILDLYAKVVHQLAGAQPPITVIGLLSHGIVSGAHQEATGADDHTAWNVSEAEHHSGGGHTATAHGAMASG